MNKEFFISRNPEQTMKFAEKLIQQIQHGAVICLKGDLGAGKTIFVKGLARGLGITELITSPTFVLMKKYNIRIRNKAKNRKLYHIDCYRLKNSNDLLSLGFKSWVKNDNIIVIEWGDKVRDILPKNRINIKISIVDEKTRKISYY